MVIPITTNPFAFSAARKPKVNSKVLLLDNRDSFTWNLAQAFAELGADVDVVETDAIDAEAILSRAPRLLCVGPGPRGPSKMPHLMRLLAHVDGKMPIFGVCLGLQALLQAFGGSITRALEPVHGKRSLIHHDGGGVFHQLPSPLWVMRYHSLLASHVPSRFVITARDEHEQVMAIRDVDAGIEAVQFHPESIGTDGGMLICQNVLQNAGITVRALPTRPGHIPPAPTQDESRRDRLGLSTPEAPKLETL